MTKIVKENIKMTENEKKLLVELICNEQTHMIVKDHTSYDTFLLLNESQVAQSF